MDPRVGTGGVQQLSQRQWNSAPHTAAVKQINAEYMLCYATDSVGAMMSSDIPHFQYLLIACNGTQWHGNIVHFGRGTVKLCRVHLVCKAF